MEATVSPERPSLALQSNTPCRLSPNANIETDVDRNTSIGLSIHKDFQNKGYGSEAIRWILGYAFVMAGMHSVSIEAVGYNERAIHVYQKLGFVPEGRRRQQLWYRGGWHDFVQFGMLESEWRAQQQKEGGIWVENLAA